MLPKVTLTSLILAATLVSSQSAPSFSPTTVKGHFVEQFDYDSSDDFGAWSASKATKEEKAGEVFSYVGKWSIEEPSVYPGIAGDKGLVLKSKAAHHAISVPFDEPLDNKGKTLVVQYEVKLQKGLDCGGAYLKLLSESETGIQAEEFSDKTPYTIMFGPDRCGATSKVHFIFRHANPLTGEIEEKHLISPPAPKTVKTSSLYTLVVRPDQTYEILIDSKSAKTGSLLTDFSPAVNPPEEIDDPTDFKPDDWIDAPKITDPEATKPEDWDEDAPQNIEDLEAEMPEGWLEDEEATVPDPDADKPEEWSDEDDGEWIAPPIANPLCVDAPGCGKWTRPLVPNPDYKGKWFAPLIDNPDYKGPWAAKKIANPDYFEDKTPADFNKIAGLGFELWSMTEDILFDNIYIGHSESDAALLASESFAIKKPLEDAQESEEQLKKANEDMKATPEPDMKQDPVAWAKWKWDQFVTLAMMRPSHAFKEMPGTGAAVVVAFATAVGMLGVFFSFLLPTKKTVKQTKETIAKKTDAITADVKDAAEKIKDAPIAEKVEEVKEGVKTRAGKGKAAEK